MLQNMENLRILFCVFATLGTTAAKPIEGDANSSNRQLNGVARVRPKQLAGNSGIHLLKNAMHAESGKHFDLLRQLEDVLLQKKMDQVILKSWFGDDPSIRGTSTTSSRGTTQTTAPTSTTEVTMTTTAATTTQEPLQTAPPNFWEIFWNLWKLQHNNPFG